MKDFLITLAALAVIFAGVLALIVVRLLVWAGIFWFVGWVFPEATAQVLGAAGMGDVSMTSLGVMAGVTSLIFSRPSVSVSKS